MREFGIYACNTIDCIACVTYVKHISRIFQSADLFFLVSLNVGQRHKYIPSAVDTSSSENVS